MQVDYPLEWVLEMLEEMGYVFHSYVGWSMSFRRAGLPRRLLIPILPEVPEYILIDNAEDARALDEFYKARDLVVKRHSA